ncbi:signal peptidase I [Halalkalibacillus sediminis]|uniref:Signal peptidase I n=1 Tax=Halalkalibacillus sediminis TaxID=2018042 RepID=A0A2I0QS90_9BACI|nr:signal peptidase I [Halalkalibacillus sediminis]PKR77201.1 signal peptidase I [Halalkalibacillus sediminis]
MKAIKWIGKVVNVFLIVALVFTSILVFTNLSSDGPPQIFGQELKVVYSGSMEPEIKTGAVIGINPNIDKNSIKVGEVIMFQSEPGVYVTHRVMDVTQNDSGVLYTTKGDNNESADINPVQAENVYGVHSSINIPFVGYMMDYANSSMGVATLLIIPGIILLLSSIKSIYQAIRLRKEDVQSDSI